jgi:hypothetical protein
MRSSIDNSVRIWLSMQTDERMMPSLNVKTRSINPSRTTCMVFCGFLVCALLCLGALVLAPGSTRVRSLVSAAFYVLLVTYPLAALLLLAIMQAMRRRIRAYRCHVCPRCEYPLRGLHPKSNCPECGTPYSIQEVEAHWRMVLDEPQSHRSEQPQNGAE